MTDIQLVLMPFGSIEHPSIALGTLKACLTRIGFSCAVDYANLRFADTIGLINYNNIDAFSCLANLGEWIFAGDVFPHHAAQTREYLELIGIRDSVNQQAMTVIRDRVSPFLDQSVERILDASPLLVGCSSTFQQHVASLALLKRIKDVRPATLTVLGGGNCEGIMGWATHHHFPWIDFVVSGEGDEILPRLCELAREYGSDIPPHLAPAGLYVPAHRDGSLPPPAPPRAAVTDLNNLPIPDYSDYFSTLQTLPIARYIKPGIFFETSRGCWWGMKHQCTFCGTHPQAIRYRTKQPQRIVTEIRQLADETGVRNMLAVDSILDMSYFKSVFPALAEEDNGYYIHFETKSNLRKEHLALLARAGIRLLQPGIESFNDEMLRYFSKGNFSWMNVQFLKWTLELGISVIWNLIVEVPGEQEHWYAEMAELVPLLVHLHPPIAGRKGLTPLQYFRYSPMFENQQQYGLRLEPFWTYHYIYPLGHEQLRHLVCYFHDISQHALARSKGLSPELERLQEEMLAWQKSFFAYRPDLMINRINPHRPRLDMEDDGNRILIQDTRPCAVQPETVLEGMAAAVYRACDRACTREELIKALASPSGTPPNPAALQSVLAELKQNRLLLESGGRFLALAVTRQRPPLPLLEDYPGGIMLLPRLRTRRLTDPAQVQVEDLFGLRSQSREQTHA